MGDLRTVAGKGVGRSRTIQGIMWGAPRTVPGIVVGRPRTVAGKGVGRPRIIRGIIWGELRKVPGMVVGHLRTIAGKGVGRPQNSPKKNVGRGSKHARNPWGAATNIGGKLPCNISTNKNHYMLGCGATWDIFVVFFFGIPPTVLETIFFSGFAGGENVHFGPRKMCKNAQKGV